MKISEIEDKYPLVAELLFEEADYYAREKTVCSLSTFFREKIIKSKGDVALSAYEKTCKNITEPVWSLCELILKGDIYVSLDENDRCKSLVGLGDILIRTGLREGWSPEVLEGDIFNNPEERECYISCIGKVRQQETLRKKNELRDKVSKITEEVNSEY